jgi:hypothetical protein
LKIPLALERRPMAQERHAHRTRFTLFRLGLGAIPFNESGSPGPELRLK